MEKSIICRNCGKEINTGTVKSYEIKNDKLIMIYYPDFIEVGRNTLCLDCYNKILSPKNKIRRKSKKIKLYNINISNVNNISENLGRLPVAISKRVEIKLDGRIGEIKDNPVNPNYYWYGENTIDIKGFVEYNETIDTFKFYGRKFRVSDSIPENSIVSVVYYVKKEDK